MSRACCAVEPLEGRLLLSGTPAAPANVLATNGSTPTDVEVTWDASSGATSYEVWRSTTANTTTATDIASDVTGTSFDDTSVTVGTTYFYWVVAANSSGDSAYSTIASATGGTLVWDDTFGVDGITSAWGAFNSTDPNNPNVIYTNTTPSESSSSNPTTLAVVSNSQATDGQALAMSLTPAPGESGYYDSAEICTEVDPSGVANDMEYGEIQARIQIPGGDNSGAIWPAFWLLGDDINSVGWPSCGEIDVMENKGSEPGTIFSTIHGPTSGGGDYNGGEGVGGSYSLSGDQDFYSSFHIFSVSWGPNYINFSVDGQSFETLTPSSLPSGGSWVFNGQPFFIILDVCEGGDFAPGKITSTQTMDVDYVRAYSLPAPTGVTAVIATDSTPAELSWNAVDGATSYGVWRSTSSNVSSASQIADEVSGTSYNDTSAIADDNYYYWVTATNATQASGYSASAYTKHTPTVTLSSPPSDITYDGTSDVTDWASAQVTGVSGVPAPTGSASLAWYSGTTDTGTPLSSAPMTVGTYTVVANYPGDNNYDPAQSAPVTFTINNPNGLSTANGTQYTITWNASTPTLDVSTGTVTLSTDLSTEFPGYDLTVAAGATVVLDAGQHVGLLQIMGNGTVNVESTWMILNYGSGSDPIGTIESYLASGYNGGFWDGSGINSSSASSSFGKYGLGYADGADGAVSGLSSGQIEILYTLYGDTNLDGTVNGVDFGNLAANFGKSGANIGWAQGAFTYNNTVNGVDFGLLAGNFGQSSGISLPTVVLQPSTVAATPLSITTPSAATKPAAKSNASSKKYSAAPQPPLVAAASADNLTSTSGTKNADGKFLSDH